MIRAKEYTVKQQRLIPTDLRDMLPENDLSLLIAEIAEVLDITEIEKKFASTVGPLPYHPRMMISLLLYGYCTGVYSSRKIERNTYVDIGFNFLAGGYHPDHVSIARFRNENIDDFEDIFLQVIIMCKKAGLVKLGKVAIDGTKIKANASIRKTKSYEAIAKEYTELELIVNELVGKAKRIDTSEDKRYGADKRGDELPEKLRNARNRMKELERIKEEMEIEAKEIAQRKDEMIAEREQEEKQTGKKKRGRKPKRLSQIPDEKARHNFTDPDSKIMRNNADGAFIQGYNAQSVVDVDSQVILTSEVTQEENDKHMAALLIFKLMDVLGVDDPAELANIKITLDAGYFTETEIEKLVGMGFDIYITPDGYHSKGKKVQLIGRIPKDMSFIDRMRRKVKTIKGKKIYAKRKIVEAPFGQIKEARGFRRFSMRGLRNVKGEWNLITLTHNILVMHRNNVTIE
jgi:transposase